MVQNTNKRDLEKKCITYVGKEYFRVMKNAYLKNYGNDMWELALPEFLNKFSKQAEIITKTAVNSAEIDDIKAVFVCLFARKKHVISKNRIEEIVLDVLKLLINTSDIYCQMISRYTEAGNGSTTYPKAFSITDKTIKSVPDYQKVKELTDFVKSKGYEINIVDAGRQVFPYTYFDTAARAYIDCVVYFHV